MALSEQSALEQSHPLLQDAQLDAYLELLVARLWKLVETDLPRMTIRVIKNPEPNAVVYANGVCYLTSGMLAQVENEDQLAMIIAHELVHYTRRDSLEAFVRDTALGSELTEAGDHFTSAAEKRADLEGMGLIRQAGYCPQQILDMLADFQNNKTPVMFSRGASPMSFGERIAGIETLLAAEAAGMVCSSLSDRNDFRVRTAPALLANAEAAVQRGVWETADASIAGYLEMVSDNPQAYFIMGQIRLGKPERNLQGAMDAFETAIHLNQRFLPAYRALGVLHLKAGDFKAARILFEYCLAEAPEAPENKYIRGYLQLCLE